MTRDEAIALLPCFVAGDLPEEVAEEVAAAIEQDAALRELAEGLRTINTIATDAVIRLDMPDLEAEPPPVIIEPLRQPANAPAPSTAQPRVRLWLPVVTAAAAVALAFGLVWTLAPSGEPPRSITERVAADVASGALTSLPIHDTDALRAALEAAGVPESATRHVDLSAIGLTLTGAYVLEGAPAGVAFQYTDGTNTFLCQVWARLPIPTTAEVRRTVEGVELRGTTHGTRAEVVWVEDGLVCVMSARMALDDLLAVVEARIRRTA